MLGIRELKHRYKLLRAEDRALSLADLGLPLPLSCGSPLIDSMLNERIAATPGMNEEEHLMRSWQLITSASERELDIVFKLLDGCLNDHKLLFAVYLFGRGDEKYRLLLERLPMKWRLLFPTAVIKPAAAFFTGWRRDIRFRLVDNVDFAGLKRGYHETLAKISDEQIMKYRDILREALALLHWKADGERELAIHDWCFGGGRMNGAIPLLSNYLRVRGLVAAGNRAGLAKELGGHEHRIPLTSFMGLLSNMGLHLSVDGNEAFRDYAVATATPIEAMLRLHEWGGWLDVHHIKEIALKATDPKGLQIPFHKVATAYISAPASLKPQLFDQIYVPVMKRFSSQMAEFIPKGTQMVLLQPNSFVNIMSLLFLATISYERSTRILLAGEDVKEHDDRTILGYDKLRDVLFMSRSGAEGFLLNEFGGHALRRSWRFDERVVASAFDRIDGDDLLILDLPFVFSTRILERLLHMKRVLNLANNFGSPSEVSLSVKYIPRISIRSNDMAYFGYSRFSEPAVSSLAGFIERLEWFDRAGGVIAC